MIAWYLVIGFILFFLFAIRYLTSLKQAVVAVREGETTNQHSDKDRAQVGSTAFAVSAFRAYETTRTDRPPLVSDPVSVALFSSMVTSPLSPKTKIFFTLVDYLYKGAFSWWVPVPFSLVKNTRIVKLVDLLSLRTHFIDEHVAAAHDGSGVEQLVILGAGLDARGYRLKEFKGKVYEVDFPGMLKKKKEIFENVGFPKPSNVFHVGTDFSLPTPCWDKDLSSQGYDPNRPSVWVLEGLTSYLTPSELCTLFTILSSCSAPGSLLLITWLGVGKKPTDLGTTAKLDMHKFNLNHPDDLSSFPLETNGWELNEALSIGEASQMYFKKDWKRGILADDQSYWLTCHILKQKK